MSFKTIFGRKYRGLEGFARVQTGISVYCVRSIQIKLLLIFKLENGLALNGPDPAKNHSIEEREKEEMTFIESF